MKCYRKILRIPSIAHRTNSSILNELHPPTNRLYNFEWRKNIYFGLVTRHNGLEKIIMQGMVAGKRSRGKPRQRWEKHITDIFGTMATASRVVRTGIDFAMIFGQPRPEEDMLSEEDVLHSNLYKH